MLPRTPVETSVRRHLVGLPTGKNLAALTKPPARRKKNLPAGL
jgi:hypothetical protein